MCQLSFIKYYFQKQKQAHFVARVLNTWGTYMEILFLNTRSSLENAIGWNDAMSWEQSFPTTYCLKPHWWIPYKNLCEAWVKSNHKLLCRVVTVASQAKVKVKDITAYSVKLESISTVCSHMVMLFKLKSFIVN